MVHVAMKGTAKPVTDSVARYRIHVTFATAAVFGAAGLVVAWLKPPQHPDDRLADLLIASLGLAVIGTLLGYVVSSVYYRRMSTVDAFVCVAIPVYSFFGFVFVKSGDWFRYRFLSYGVLAMIAYLGLRVCYRHTSRHTAATTRSAEDVEDPDSRMAE